MVKKNVLHVKKERELTTTLVLILIVLLTTVRVVKLFWELKFVKSVMRDILWILITLVSNKLLHLITV